MIQRNLSILQLSENSLWFNYDTGGYKGKALALNDQERIDYINQLKTLLSQSKNLNFGNTIYTGNLSSIPRFKLKEYINENKLKRTSRQEYCDSIIIDKNFITSTLKTLKNAEKHEIIKDNSNIENFNLLKKILKQSNRHQSYELNIPEQTWVLIYGNYNSGSNGILQNSSSDQDVVKYIKNSNIEELYYLSLYRDKNLENVIQLLDFLKANPNINVIFDEFLLEKLNEEGLDIDDDYLETLENMFSSNQNDSIKLAIEMLSNIKLSETNALTIALLLNKHQHVFDHGSGITPSSMNSFKIIDKYYKSRGIVWKSEWRLFASGLYKNYKNDLKNKQVIDSFILSNLNNFIGNKFHINSFDLAFQD